MEIYRCIACLAESLQHVYHFFADIGEVFQTMLSATSWRLVKRRPPLQCLYHIRIKVLERPLLVPSTDGGLVQSSKKYRVVKFEVVHSCTVAGERSYSPRKKEQIRRYSYTLLDANALVNAKENSWMHPVRPGFFHTRWSGIHRPL